MRKCYWPIGKTVISAVSATAVGGIDIISGNYCRPKPVIGTQGCEKLVMPGSWLVGRCCSKVACCTFAARLECTLQCAYASELNCPKLNDFRSRTARERLCWVYFVHNVESNDINKDLRTAWNKDTQALKTRIMSMYTYKKGQSVRTCSLQQNCYRQLDVQVRLQGVTSCSCNVRSTIIRDTQFKCQFNYCPWQ